MALTLNNLVQKLEEFVTNHEILNSWYFNDPWDGLKDGETVRYPMMFGRLKPSKIGENTDYTTFEIFVCDKVKKDKGNETEAASDTKQLAKDLLSYLQQTTFLNADGQREPLRLKKDVILDHFFESFDDEVTGCKFDLEIKTAFEWDICSVPITGAPVQPNLNMLNSLENYTVTGSSQTIAHTPATGGMYLSFIGGGYLTEGVGFVRTGTTITFYQDYTVDQTPLDCTGLLFTVAYQY